MTNPEPRNSLLDLRPARGPCPSHADDGAPTSNARTCTARPGALGLAVLLACGLAGCAGPWSSMSTGEDRRGSETRRRVVPPGIVSVTYADPSRFSEALANPQESAKTRQAWLDALCIDLSDRAAAALAPGQRLEVRLTDVRRAARVTPPAGAPLGAANGEARTPRSGDAPLIELDFRLLAADGSVARQGHRQLRDTGAMARMPGSAGNAVRDEKALAADWVAKEFGPAR